MNYDDLWKKLGVGAEQKGREDSRLPGHEGAVADRAVVVGQALVGEVATKWKRSFHDSFFLQSLPPYSLAVPLCKYLVDTYISSIICVCTIWQIS
jgi:hypothetical protein